MKVLGARTMCAILLAMAALPATAEPFVAGSGGRSKAESILCTGSVSCDTRSGAYTVRGGYRFNQWFALEARYVDLGKATANRVVGQAITDTTSQDIVAPVDYSTTGGGIDVIGTLPFADRWAVSGLVGVGRMHTRVTSPSLLGGDSQESAQSGTKAYYGVSLSYDVGYNVLVSFEAERYRSPLSDSLNIDMYGIGLTYRFR